MRIATWNVNGLRARLEFVRAWLEERQPDVVGLQELKLPSEAFPHAEFAALGYQAAVQGQKGWNGVAVLARCEPLVVDRGLAGQEDFGARLITADVGPLRFTSVYGPNGKSLEHPDFDRKLAWFDDLVVHLQARASERPAIVGGDFNVCPGPLDSWDEERLAGSIFHTDAERQRFAALLAAGYRDAYRMVHPEGRDFSWWDYRGGAFHRRHGLRIDMLLVNEAAAARVVDVWIDRDYRKKRDDRTPSDHAPVVLELRFDDLR